MGNFRGFTLIVVVVKNASIFQPKKGPREFICLSIVYHVLIKLDNNSEIVEERYLQFDQFKAFV